MGRMTFQVSDMDLAVRRGGRSWFDLDARPWLLGMLGLPSDALVVEWRDDPQNRKTTLVIEHPSIGGVISTLRALLRCVNNEERPCLS